MHRLYTSKNLIIFLMSLTPYSYLYRIFMRYLGFYILKTKKIKKLSKKKEIKF